MFSYHNYCNLLKKIKKKRNIITFSDYLKKKKIKQNFLILRHDIEYFPLAALELAKIEKKLNIRSTYFFLITSTYNIFSELNIDLVDNLKKMGHEFGLHYDASLLKNNLKLKIEKNIKNQIKLFEEYYSCKISAISCHRPKKYYENIKIKSILNVYDHNFQKKVKYFSDSQQRYRENIDDLLNSDKNLHFLVHEYTWSPKNDSWQRNIKNFSKNENDKLKFYYYKTIDQWNLGLKKRVTEHIKFKKKILKK